MKNMELLAPAGDKECLIAAVQNGADAIYLGGTMFNARAFAKNFTPEELKWAVEYAHLHFVKIYVTVNTLYRDDEFDELVRYLDYLYDIQVDALIVQEIGLFLVIKKRYPDFEIHMSTQASIMNLQAVKFFEEKGASRVVLARENTLEEVRYICQNTSLEIEVFVHGALCICYSGQCLMSSFIGKRSGNRGQCAQPCRLPFQLKEDQHILPSKASFLLSPKDLMTIEQIGELIDAGISSFKIEGRMKKPEYVACTVRAYRRAIDAHLHKQKINFKEDIADMKAMFNRDYTKGYLFHDSYLVKGDYSGNKGVIIGKVQNYSKKKKRVSVLLKGDLNQGDSIVFENIDKGRPTNKIYLKNKLVSHAHAGDLIEIEFKYPVYQGLVRKTVDTQITQKLAQSYHNNNRKSSSSMEFNAKLDQPMTLKVCCKEFQITIESKQVVEKAIKTPLTQQRIIEQLSKTGEYPFYIHKIDTILDQKISIPIKAINELRREALERLKNQIEHQIIHHFPKQEIKLKKQATRECQKEIHVLVSNLQQLEAIVDTPIDCLYYPYQEDTEKAFEICQKHHLKMALFITRICKDQQINEIKLAGIYSRVQDIIVNEYGALYAFQGKNLILGTGFNIYNSYALQALNMPTILSLEMSQEQLKQLKYLDTNIFVQVYGKVENMISEYCPITQHYFGYQKKHCGLCQKHQYTLIDRKNEEFELMMDEQCRMHLLNCRTLIIQPQYIHNQHFFLHFTNEDSQITRHVVDSYYQAIRFKKDLNLYKNFKFTTGYFK